MTTEEKAKAYDEALERAKALHGTGYTRPFCVQKRFLGFLWWYDPLDDGMYSDGKFKTLGEAKQAIAELQQNEKRIVIWEE